MVCLGVSCGECCSWCWSAQFSSGVSAGWWSCHSYSHTSCKFLKEVVNLQINSIYNQVGVDLGFLERGFVCYMYLKV